MVMKKCAFRTTGGARAILDLRHIVRRNLGQRPPLLTLEERGVIGDQHAMADCLALRTSFHDDLGHGRAAIVLDIIDRFGARLVEHVDKLPLPKRRIDRN